MCFEGSNLEGAVYLYCLCIHVKYGHLVKQSENEWVAAEDGRRVHVIL